MKGMNVRRYAPFPTSTVDVFEADAIENSRIIEYWESFLSKSPDDYHDPRWHHHNVKIAKKKLAEEKQIRNMMAL